MTGPADAEPPAETGPAGDSAWSSRVTRHVAVQVRHWRRVRKLTAQELSDRTRDLGYAIPRAVLANIENLRRDTISVAELLVLAAALDVPPTILIAPVGIEPTTEVLPGVEIASWLARGWLMGTRHPTYEGFSLARWDEARQSIVLYDIHRLLINEYLQIQDRLKRLLEQARLEQGADPDAGGDAQQAMMLLTQGIQELAASLKRLADHRQLIVAEGYTLPDLPPAMAVAIGDVSQQRLDPNAGESAQLLALVRAIVGQARGHLRGPQDPG